MARADAIITESFANFDFANNTEEQLAYELADALKKSLNSETFLSFDTSNKAGQSINNRLREETLVNVNATAREMAKVLYARKTLDPETNLNQRKIIAALKTAKDYGADALVGSPLIKTLQLNALRERNVPLIGTDISAMSEQNADIIANINKGTDIRGLNDLVLWRINNAQSATVLQENEATLRAASVGSPDFESALQKVFTITKQYVNDENNDVDPSNGYAAAELILRNPKVQEHLSKKWSNEAIKEILDSLKMTSTKAKLALQEQDRITQFNRVQQVEDFISKATTKSFGKPKVQQEQ